MYTRRHYDTKGERVEIAERFDDIHRGVPTFDVELTACGRTLMPLSVSLWAVKRVHLWRVGGAGTYKRSQMKRFGEYLTERRADFELAMRGATGWGESMDMLATANGVARFHVYPDGLFRIPARDVEICFDRDQAKHVGSRILKLIEGRVVPPERPVLTDEDRIRQLRAKLKEKDALIKRLQK